ncbi:unnamed protein product [Bathycoccus prasinos]
MLRGTVGFSSFSSCSCSCSFSTTITTPGTRLFPRSLAAKSNSFLAAKKTRTAACAAKKRSVLSSIKTNNSSSSSFHSEKVVSTEEEEDNKEETRGRDWTEKMAKRERSKRELNLEEHVRPKWSRDRETENVPSTSRALLSIAPMMEYTHNHFRYLCRLLSKRVWLWTEMEVDMTLKHVPVELRNKYVDFTLNQHPLVMQLGGSDADALGFSVSLAKPHGYDEINLNCGCPSEKVAGKGCFGATLMRDPDLVAECCAAMAKNADGIPISVKCRIGVDGNDSYDELYRFVETIASKSPVRRFHVHCRKALLNGISPSQNRSIPPLRHEWVYALARDFPECEFFLNGGVKTLEEVKTQLRCQPTDKATANTIKGVMIGRQAHADPWGLLSRADVELFGESENPCKSRRDLLAKYAKYCDATQGKNGTMKDGSPVPAPRHFMHSIQNIFAGCTNAKIWKRLVDDQLQGSRKKEPNLTVTEIMERTLGCIPDEVLDAPPGYANFGSDAPAGEYVPIGEGLSEEEKEWTSEVPVVGGNFLARKDLDRIFS